MDPTANVVRFVSANVDFVRGHDRKYVQALTEWGDVIALQEAKTFVLADLLPPGWVSLQDTTNDATKGSCIAYNADALTHHWDRLALGANPIIGGRRIGLLPRYFQLAGFSIPNTDRGFVAVSAHEPPFRFRALQPGYGRRLKDATARNPNVVVGVDANMPIGALGHALGLEAYGKGIVGVLTRLPVIQSHVNPWGVNRGLTDHPAVVVHVAIPKEKP